MEQTASTASAGPEGSVERSHACGYVGPSPGYAAMTEQEIMQEMETLRPVWRLAEDKNSISTKFTCKTWQAAIHAIQEISSCAESNEINHHPDLHLTNYRELEIVVSTHATGGLTKFDFLLAQAIDRVNIEYSPKWLRENPKVIERRYFANQPV
jgi:4a-hydroxytetrahydrobiopterin dehydratase